jgi:RNA polymerase sigma factor (sigma-70 family)
MEEGLSTRKHFDAVFASIFEGKSPESISTLAYIRRLLYQYRLANVYEVKDIIVEVYARGIKSIVRGEVIHRPQPWIRRVALYVIREFRRAADRIQYNELNDDSYLIATESNTLSALILQDDLATIMQAFDELPEQDKRILHLRIVNGLSWQEISVELSHGGSKMSESSLRQKGFRALRHLRAVYDSKQEDFRSIPTANALTSSTV